MLGEGLGMAKDNPTKYNGTPRGFKASEQRFVSRKLGVEYLVPKLRELIDKIADPTFCYEQPVEYARAYGLFIILLQTQDLSRKYIRHNLGKKRWELIQKIIQNVKEQVEGATYTKKE